MDYRIGKCSDCGAEFKVPASFAHDVARCRKCSGVVHLGPPGGPAPEPGAKTVPAQKVVKRRDPVEVSAAEAEQKRKQRGTLARLKAERAAAAAAGGAGAASASPKPAAPKQGSATGAAKGAPASTRGARPAASRSGATRATGAARGGAKRRGGLKKDLVQSKASSRPGAHRKDDGKKKAPLGLLLGLVVVVVGGGLGLYFSGILGGGDEPTNTSEVAAAGSDTDTAAADDAVTAQEAAVEAAPEPEPEPEVAESEPEEESAPAAPAPTTDMSEIEDFGPARGTTDEEWAEMNADMALFMDIYAGAKGTRAGRALESMGRKAYPVILNHMKTLDFSTEEGYRAGFSCQKTLETLLNGNNFGWKNQEDEGYVEFNKKVVLAYAKLWRQVQESIEAWIRAAKLETKDPELAAELRRRYGDGSADEADPVPTADPGFDEGLEVD